MEDPGPSVQDWRNHLLNSLKGTGRLDTLKSQLRARLVDQLRDHDGTLLEFKGNRKPSVTERILTSLFLDYLQAYGFSFTQSVFLPESQAVSWPTLTFEEMSQLLQLDFTKSFRQCLKIGPREKGCLAQQLVIALQQMPFRIGTHDSSSQTQGPQDLDGCLREIDESCYQTKAAECRMTFRTLEERLNTFRQEFETRVEAEVALKVSRVRECEISAVHLEEEARYRRQLAREREELEQVHKTRLERIREREESVMEQLVKKEKAIETSAYEQRQKLLASITDLRDREDRVKDKEDQQRRLEGALEEKDVVLRMKEAEIAQRAATIQAQPRIDDQVKIKDLEEKYRICQEQLQSERNLLEAERATHREANDRLGSELAAVKSDRDLHRSLHERLASDEKQSMELVKTLLERLTSEEEQRKLSLKKMEDVHIHNKPYLDRSVKSSLLETGHLQNDRSENTHDFWEEKSQGEGCNICQQRHRRWAREQKKLQVTIKHLERAAQEAEESKEKAHHARRAIQLQLKSSDSELLETVTLLKKTQHALELERLHHYSLRSQLASVSSLPSQDKFRHEGTVSSLDPGYVLTNVTCLKTGCGSVLAMKDPGTTKHNKDENGQLPSHNERPCPNKTKRKLRDPTPVERPSSTRIYEVDSSLTSHKERTLSTSSSISETNPSCKHTYTGVIDRNQSDLPNQQDDLAAGDGFRIEPFGQGRTEVESASEWLGCISDIHRKQTSEKHTQKTAGRFHQGESAKNSCPQPIPVANSSAPTEASQVLVQISPPLSAQEVRLEAKHTASANFQETSQSRTNYFVLGTHSTRGNTSELDLVVNGKTVKHSSSLDTSREDKVQTNIDVTEMKFRKKVHSSRSRDNERCLSGQQKLWRSTHSDCQEDCDEISEVYTSKLVTKTGSRGQNNDVLASCGSEDFNLDSVDKQTYIPAHRNEMQELGTKRSELEKKRPQGDEALYKLSCQRNQDEVRPRTLDNQQHIPVHYNTNDEETVQERELPMHTEQKSPLSNPANSPGVNKESCASGLSKPADPTGNPKCDLRQWFTDEFCMDLELQDQAKPSNDDNNQQQIEATLHASEDHPGDDELRKSVNSEGLHSEVQKQRVSNVSINQDVSGLQAPCKQSEILSTRQILAPESINPLEKPESLRGASSEESSCNPTMRKKQHVSNVSINEDVSGLQAPCKQSEILSTRQILAPESINPLEKPGILRGASSEESSCNPTMRTSSVQNTQEILDPIQMASEAIPYWTDSQQYQGQNRDEDSAGSTRVQSEQGSYSPGEGNDGWTDFQTEDNANYLDNSDVFSEPESDDCPSRNLSSKEDIYSSSQPLSPELD